MEAIPVASNTFFILIFYYESVVGGAHSLGQNLFEFGVGREEVGDMGDIGIPGPYLFKERQYFVQREMRMMAVEFHAVEGHGLDSLELLQFAVVY